MTRICFVCLGNICRSPTAEGVMQRLIDEQGLGEQIELDSAGTGGWHLGEHADRRSRAAAQARGYDLTSISRKVKSSDFDDFDYVIAMDSKNLHDLQRMRGPWKASDEHPTILQSDCRAKLAMLRTFDKTAPQSAEVPDPYYGSGDGFETVLDICERACRGLLKYVQTQQQ